MGKKKESPCVRCPYDWDSDVCDNSGGEATCLKWKAWAFDNMHGTPGRPKRSSSDSALIKDLRDEIKMLKYLRRFDWAHVSHRSPTLNKLVLGKLKDNSYCFVKMKKDKNWYNQDGGVVDNVEFWKEIE